MPFVDLAFPESESLGNLLNIVATPVVALLELNLKHFNLLLVLSLSALNVSSTSILILRLLEECGHAIIQVIKVKA